MIRRIYFSLLLCAPYSMALAQSCVESIIPTTDVRDYKVNTNGTAVNRHNGIMWIRCALGQSWKNNKCIGKATFTTWDQAKTLAGKFTFESFDNWRLPSIHELSMITELSCQKPAANLLIFPDAPSVSFWAGTEFINNKNNAWQVFFGSGENHTAKKSTTAAVRLVRTIKKEKN